MAEGQVAVLIDVENVGLSPVQELFDQLANVGRIIVKRAYGDWSGARTRDRDRLQALGFNITIYPAIGMLPAAGSMKRAFEALLRDGSTANVDAPMISLPEMHTLMGFEDVWAFERRWARPEAEAAE